MIRILVLLAIFLAAIVSGVIAEEAAADLEQPLFPAETCPDAGALADAAAAPQPIWLNHCSAIQECPNGTLVSCQGHQSCIVGPDYVSCDGNVFECSDCTAPQGCTDPVNYCYCVDGGEMPTICRQTYCF